MSGFKPISLDGRAAARALVAKGKVRAGYCLEEVDKAFGAPRSDRVYPYANAAQALRRARELGALRTTSIAAAPEGAILYYTYSDLGHIAIKGAGGKVATIDYPTRGKSALVDPSAMARDWPGVKFVGWATGAGAYLGNTVTVGVGGASRPGEAPNQRAIVIAAIARGYKGANGDLYTEPVQQFVEEFQGVVGLLPDRDVGPQTWAKFKVLEDKKRGGQTARGLQALLRVQVDGNIPKGGQTDTAALEQIGVAYTAATAEQIGQMQAMMNAGVVRRLV